MCLLIVSFLDEPGFPLVVAANRDERYARPSRPPELLGTIPRTLAGRDEVAGGTWLAVNERGVVAGLTNRPVAGGPDATRRSRGLLSLSCTEQSSAAAAVEALLEQVCPDDYNPCWLLVGDRSRLYAVESVPGKRLLVNELAPGRHVLENSPIDVPTAKTAFTRGQLEAIPAGGGELALTDALTGVLADHTVPPPLSDGDGAHASRGPERSSACVHGEGFGTVSATIAFVPADPDALPLVRFADGPPCVTAFRDVTPLWGDRSSAASAGWRARPGRRPGRLDPPPGR